MPLLELKCPLIPYNQRDNPNAKFHWRKMVSYLQEGGSNPFPYLYYRTRFCSYVGMYNYSFQSKIMQMNRRINSNSESSSVSMNFKIDESRHWSVEDHEDPFAEIKDFVFSIQEYSYSNDLSGGTFTTIQEPANLVAKDLPAIWMKIFLRDYAYNFIPNPDPTHRGQSERYLPFTLYFLHPTKEEPPPLQLPETPPEPIQEKNLPIARGLSSYESDDIDELSNNDPRLESDSEFDQWIEEIQSDEVELVRAFTQDEVLELWRRGLARPHNEYPEENY